MPRLNNFSIKIETGDAGTDTPVRCAFNGHTLALEKIGGGTGPDEIYEGEFAPRSFAHSFTILGPIEGEWKIKRMTVTYDCDDGSPDPYTITFGEVTLDASTEVDVWQERPLPTFDV